MFYHIKPLHQSISNATAEHSTTLFPGNGSTTKFSRISPNPPNPQEYLVPGRWISFSDYLTEPVPSPTPPFEIITNISPKSGRTPLTVMTQLVRDKLSFRDHPTAKTPRATIPERLIVGPSNNVHGSLDVELIEKIPESIARASAADQEWYVVHVLALWFISRFYDFNQIAS